VDKILAIICKQKVLNKIYTKKRPVVHSLSTTCAQVKSGAYKEEKKLSTLSTPLLLLLLLKDYIKTIIKRRLAK